MKKTPISLFLDSGAFSAKSKGVTIDIDAYIAFIKGNLQHLDVYSNLDVIGDPVGTWKNQEYMEAQGLKPLPVYHAGEGRKYLDRCLKYGYFAIGGVADSSNDERAATFDWAFSIVCPKENNHLPVCKVHGFAITALGMMLRYPWYSVDSTSWVMTSRMGSVYVPRFKGGKWIYDENSWKIIVSTRSPAKGDKDKHFDTLSPEVQNVILDYFHEKGYQVGKSEFRMESKSYKLKSNERWHEGESGGKREVELILEEGLSNSYKKRDEMNIIYFLDLEKSIPAWPWPFKKSKTGFGLL